MTLNAKIGGFMDFLGDFGLWDTLQERIAPKPIETNMDKLLMKFSALNVDFDCPSLDFPGSRKPAQESIKERYPRKSRDKILEIDRQFANRNCYRLSRVPWALAQISCIWQMSSDVNMLCAVTLTEFILTAQMSENKSDKSSVTQRQQGKAPTSH